MNSVMMRSNNDKYDITNSHQHIFESAAVISKEANLKYRNLLNSNNSNGCGSGGGNGSEQDNIDLTIVGYSCKLYRDDFNAQRIEHKNNLIPWNGDHNLLIDRYDCRGYLYDLTPYDSDLLTEDKKNPRYTNEEIEIEKVCDDERYMFLNDKDEDNNDSNNSNESNRPYGAVKFQYDSNNTYNNNQNNRQESELNQSENNNPKSIEIPFVATDNLKLPVGMLTPETIKMNQIIVKTASFVVNQGLQMEILLKAKQASNSQFDFLNYDHYLNPYYKHLQILIKSNQINPLEFLATESTSEKENEEKVFTEDNDKNKSDSENDDDDDDDCGNYLHPLLSRSLAIASAKETNEEKSNQQNNVVEVVSNDKKFKVDDTTQEQPKLISNNEQERTEMDNKNEVQICNKKKEIIVPDNEIVRTIIEKMAEYVVRNGYEFEMNIKNRNEERFDFLHESHLYFNFYKSKVVELEKIAKNNKDSYSEIDSDSSSSIRENKLKKHRKHSSSSNESSSSCERDRHHRNSKSKKHKKHKSSDSSKHKKSPHRRRHRSSDKDKKKSKK